MPSGFTIHTKQALVVFHAWGHVTIAECFAHIDAYFRHPDADPRQRHLIDCRAVTSFESDATGIMALQARIADDLPLESHVTLLVLLAPDGPPRAFANLIDRSWNGSDMVVSRIAKTPEAAMEILGLSAIELEKILPQRVD